MTAFAGLTLSVIVFLALHNVSKTITEEDALYIEKILEEGGYNSEALKTPENFDDEMKLVLAVQKSVFNTAPGNRPIPENGPREPKQLYEATESYCADRARTMDKAYRTLGLESRYAALYSNTAGKNLIQTLLTQTYFHDVKSHALVEVKTSKGWMIVDTRALWVSVDQNGTPLSLKELNAVKDKKALRWDTAYSKDEPYSLLKDDYYIIYGLYSRHGRYYAPYTPYVPDVNWFDLLGNIKP